ncbi:hypothetical protein V6N11_028519 [Hibiscus sabdariffa]|uniref:Uncharacterized protein n=1 Tax=Hibiscus sabdariffa TaxID=183260 RepID=A0ABR2NEH0_9ROSI
MARARTCRAMHKPLQRNLARYRELGNGVIGSTAKRFLALRPTMPGNSISFVTRSPTDSINPKFSDRPPLGTGGAYPLAPRRPPRPPPGGARPAPQGGVHPYGGHPRASFRTWCAGVAPEGGPFFPHMVCGVSTRGGLPSAYGVLASRTEGHRVRTWCAIVAPEGAFLPPMVCLPPAPRGIESAELVC